ncbi:hypothetical protein SISNIDRAFT_471485 [Sistotremastrum niveocremeum HHB9708]|uniref:Uncharacterized protein n=1 Tax=Sistotremastrum niveocremeum HHB9708 TaxID=1314777 RepID=A0A164ML45_9AGAM|nr:hypothetical protein SISNIDRAFT_471485 [Sistotremastrum niveocremeum HHB9708]
MEIWKNEEDGNDSPNIHKLKIGLYPCRYIQVEQENIWSSEVGRRQPEYVCDGKLDERRKTPGRNELHVQRRIKKAECEGFGDGGGGMPRLGFEGHKLKKVVPTIEDHDDPVTMQFTEKTMSARSSQIRETRYQAKMDEQRIEMSPLLLLG